MKNIERPEIQKALLKLLDCSNEYNADCFRKDTGFSGSPFSDSLTEWANEEYNDKIKLTKLEYEILNFYKGDFIGRKDVWNVYIESNDNSDYLSKGVSGYQFKFIKAGQLLEIADILQNCEVVE